MEQWSGTPNLAGARQMELCLGCWEPNLCEYFVSIHGHHKIVVIVGNRAIQSNCKKGHSRWLHWIHISLLRAAFGVIKYFGLLTKKHLLDKRKTSKTIQGFLNFLCYSFFPFVIQHSVIYSWYVWINIRRLFFPRNFCWHFASFSSADDFLNGRMIISSSVSQTGVGRV